MTASEKGDSVVISESFSDLIAFHLFHHGTRPTGQPNFAGTPWTIKEFAEATGVARRTVNNWPKPDSVLPEEIGSLERELFGQNAVYAAWRMRLRKAYQEEKARKKTRPASEAPKQATLGLGRAPEPIRTLVGREQDLQSLHTILTTAISAGPSGGGQRAAIHGIAGLGKSAIAAAYVDRYKGHYGGIWWCNAESKTSLLTALLALALEKGLLAGGEENLEVGARLALNWVSNQETPWLLVYDDAASPEAISDCMPTGTTALLVTSQFAFWDEWFQPFALELLAAESSVELLLAITKREDRQGALLLANVLDRLPLALDHAAATCRTAHMTFHDYAQKVERLISREPPRGVHYPRSVFATFDMAITEAAKDRSSADTLMSFLAFCASSPIPMYLVAGAIADEDKREDALEALTEVSLIRETSLDANTIAVSVHKLVQAVGRIRAEERKTAQSAVLSLTTRLCSVYPAAFGGMPRDEWLICDVLTPHVLAVRGCAFFPSFAELDVLPELIGSTGDYLHERGQYSDARELLIEALESSEARSGLHPATAKHMVSLAAAYNLDGDFAEGRDLLELALAIYRQVYGPTNTQTLVVRASLARMLFESGALVEARKEYEECVAGHLETAGPDDSNTLTIQHSLAILLLEQNEPERAEEIIRTVIAARERVHGADHPWTGSSLQVLASCLQNKQEYQEAQVCLEKALSIDQATLGESHPGTAKSLASLATLRYEVGDAQGAFALIQRALAIEEAAFGNESHALVRTLTIRARLLSDIGQPDSAVEDFERCFVICRESLGSNHPATAEAALAYGIFLVKHGAPLPALEYLTHAASVREELFGVDHPETAFANSECGAALLELDRLDDAKPYFEKALSARTNAFGENSIYRADSLNKLGNLLDNAGQAADAKRAYEEALAIFEAIGVDEHQALGATFNNMASVLKNEGDLEGALVYYQRALVIFEKSSGSDDVGVCYNNIGEVLSDQGKLSEAGGFIERGMRVLEQALGVDHPTTNRARYNYSANCYTRRNFSEAMEASRVALTHLEQALGTQNQWTLDAAHVLSLAFEASGRMSDAAHIRQLYQLHR